jgi:hypothetical protein
MYKLLANDQNQYNHQVVNHAGDEFVRGLYHTNSIEGFWSLLKRGIIGIYHNVSKVHLQSYCNEFALRYNTRTHSTAQRFNFILTNTTGRLTYKQLISK